MAGETLVPQSLPYAARVREWKPLARSYRWASRAMLVYALTVLVAPVVLYFAYLPAWEAALDAEESWAVAVAVVALVYLLIGFIVWVTMLVLFLVWFHTAHLNVFQSGHRPPRFGSTWATASWFVPVINLYQPLQAMRDIYDCSADQPRSADLRWLYVGWALWIVSWVGFATSTILGLIPGIESHLMFLLIDSLSGIALVVSTLSLMRFMRQVTAIHDAHGAASDVR